MPGLGPAHPSSLRPPDALLRVLSPLRQQALPYSLAIISSIRTCREEILYKSSVFANQVKFKKIQ